MNKEEIREKHSLEALEAELWYELHFPDIDNKEHDLMKRGYKDIKKRVIELNDRMPEYPGINIHCPKKIVEEVARYQKNNLPPDDGKSYNCLYICCDYTESKCVYVVPEEIIVYQNYILMIKKNFPNFDFNREITWQMWRAVRKEAYKRVIQNLTEKSL